MSGRLTEVAFNFADAEENHDLAEDEPQVVQWLKDRMNRWVDKRLSETGKPDVILQYELGLEKKIRSIATAQKLQNR
jgi:hypothetical protein